MTETTRAFIAIELNDQIKETIRQFQAQLKPLGCDISWVKPENAHLTLKFLGDVEMKMIPTVTQTLEDSCRGTRPWDTTLTQPGVFPDLRHPRVVWIGLDDAQKRLAQLVDSLETALGNIGFSAKGARLPAGQGSASGGKKEHREFQAHITVGRIKSERKLDTLLDGIKNYKLPSKLVEQIAHVTLYKSTLTSNGPIYTVLSKFALL